MRITGAWCLLFDELSMFGWLFNPPNIPLTMGGLWLLLPMFTLSIPSTSCPPTDRFQVGVWRWLVIYSWWLLRVVGCWRLMMFLSVHIDSYRLIATEFQIFNRTIIWSPLIHCCSLLLTSSDPNQQTSSRRGKRQKGSRSSSSSRSSKGGRRSKKGGKRQRSSRGKKGGNVGKAKNGTGRQQERSGRKVTKHPWVPGT